MVKQNGQSGPDLNRPQFRKSRKGYPTNKPRPQPNNGNWLFWVVLLFIFLIFMSQNEPRTSLHAPKELSYSEFYNILQTNKETGQVRSVELVESTENKLHGIFSDGTEFVLNIPRDDSDLLKAIRENVHDFKVVVPQIFWSQMFFSFMPILLIIMFIWFLSHRGAQMGNKIWSFGKSRATVSKGKEQPFCTEENESCWQQNRRGHFLITAK